MTDEPKHRTIRIRVSTYRKLKRLAARKPEALLALIERLVDAEERRSGSIDSRIDSQEQMPEAEERIRPL